MRLTTLYVALQRPWLHLEPEPDPITQRPNHTPTSLQAP